MFVTLSDRISFLPKEDEPLSAEVFVIRGKTYTWLFDAGNGNHVLEKLHTLPRPIRAVISHFHPDHMGNAAFLQSEKLYLGDYACKKLGNGIFVTCVTEETVIRDGITLRIQPLPSSHAKGSLMLETEDFLFLGDGLYATQKNGQRAYNATVLKETLNALQKTTASRFVCSHHDPLVRPREEVFLEMQSIYMKRQKDEPYILL